MTNKKIERLSFSDGRFDASPEGMKYLSYTETEERSSGELIFKSYPAEDLIKSAQKMFTDTSEIFS